jgi:hypothetical protein
MGASNYLYAEATSTQTLPDWIGSHVRAFAYFMGVTRQTVTYFVPGNKIGLMCPSSLCGQESSEEGMLGRCADRRTHNRSQGVEPIKERLIVLPDCTRVASR